MSQASALPAARQRIKQKRGQKTYDALIATGFKLLAQREFEAITIAELARAAGYSVGAFYARFKSKDEFFDALIAQHIAERTRTREHLFATLPDDVWINEVLGESVNYYWKRRRFWRAALIRSIKDSHFWQPIREQAGMFASAFIRRISGEAGRPLTEE
jgi:AcrR family transcriptional regulator